MEGDQEIEEEIKKWPLEDAAKGETAQDTPCTITNSTSQIGTSQPLT